MRVLGPVLLTATTVPVVLATVSPGIDRLAAMPPETRLELERRLDRFELLPADQQRRIRELDEAIARLNPDERRRYLDLMRRYGAWFRGLDDVTRQELGRAPIEDRLRQIAEMLGPGGTPESPGLDPALWTRAEAFNPIPLYDAANLLHVWAELDDEAKLRVESKRLDDKLKALWQLGREQEFEPVPAVREAFGTILEAQVGLGLRKIREMFDEQSRGGGQRFARSSAGSGSGEAVSWLLDTFGVSRGRFPLAATSRYSAARKTAIRLAELEYLRTIRNRPEVVSASDLAAFEARLPEWYRGTLDPLPPEIARLRVRGLRQLVLSDPELEQWLSSRPEPPSSGAPAPVDSQDERPVQMLPF